MIPDQWYAVLESDEVKRGKPAAFRRFGQDLVFWRDAAGQVVVMGDRCPHRGAKLSLGKVVGDCIECPFHGFRYDQEGTCQLIPANGKNGPRPKVFQPQTYPVQEKYDFIWVWYGEARASYPPIPFFDELEGMDHATARKVWNTHYSRAIENQLDVAHLPFVHTTTIGRAGKTLVRGPYTELIGDSLYVWTQTELDHGQVALRPTELSRPTIPWGLCFKFPNIWLLNISPKYRNMAAFAPIDDEHTMMYVRAYHNIGKNRLARRLIANTMAVVNRPIINQDEAVVLSQQPKQGGLDSGDNYIPADRPILLYYKHRDELIRAAQQPGHDEQNSREVVEALVS